MKLQHAVAALGTTIDYAVPRKQSIAADFFHAYPRLSAASNTFSTEPAYRLSLYKLAIPYAATGLAVFLVALVANFYFFVKRGVVPGADDTQHSDPNARDRTGRAFLLFTGFLNLAIIICIGIAFGSAFSMRHAAENAHAALDAARARVEHQLHAPAALLHTLARQVARAAPRPAVSDSDAARDVVQLFRVNAPAFHRLVNATELIFQNMAVIDDHLNYLSTRFFLFTLSVLWACVLGLLCTFVGDAATPDSRKLRIAAFAILLIPLLATWAHTAISTCIAAASGDFCHSVSQYHQFIAKEVKGAPASIPQSNVFIEYGLRCPSGSPNAADLRQLNKFFGDTANLDEEFSEGFDTIMDEDNTAAEWVPAQQWMQRNLETYDMCTTQLTLAGQISFHICGDHGMSAVAAIGQLWLCSCGLTLLFIVVVALISFGHPPSEFCSGRELMYIYGAPKLISAFGDVTGAVARHSTFRKRGLAKNVSVGTSTWTSSDDLSEVERVKQDYNLDHASMSADRERHNAYTTHKLRDKRARDSDWYMGESSSSSSSNPFS